MSSSILAPPLLAINYHVDSASLLLRRQQVRRVREISTVCILTTIVIEMRLRRGFIAVANRIALVTDDVQVCLWSKKSRARIRAVTARLVAAIL